MSEKLKVSICIASYNGENYILEQLKSIQKQTVLPYEIVLSDDSSTDSTRTIVRDFSRTYQGKLVLIEQQLTLGYTRNFEEAISNATGDVVVLCDQDDVWSPRRLELIISALKSFDVVFTNGNWGYSPQNSNTMSIGKESIFETTKFSVAFLPNFYRQRFLGCQIAFRLEPMRPFLPIPRFANLITHDNWLGLAALAFLSCEVITRPVMIYRRHEQNVSSGLLGRSSNSLLVRIIIRVVVATALVKRRIQPKCI